MRCGKSLFVSENNQRKLWCLNARALHSAALQEQELKTENKIKISFADSVVFLCLWASVTRSHFPQFHEHITATFYVYRMHAALWFTAALHTPFRNHSNRVFNRVICNVHHKPEWNEGLFASPHRQWEPFPQRPYTTVINPFVKRWRTL